jgi:hypothetical protein
MHPWCWQKKTNQAGQKGTCQHSRPASHIWATRAHNIHHMGGSKPITHQLQEIGGIQMHVWGRAKENKAS